MNDYYNFIDGNLYQQAIPNDEYSSNFMYQQKISQQQEAFPQSIQNTLGLENFNENFNMMNENCGMYSPEEGFIRGNMFPELFDPYKKQQLRKFSPINEKERMMLNIQKLDFAMKDINLYLDIYPNDSCMVQKFNNYLAQRNKVLDEYESKYGPITLTRSNNSLEKTPWAWTQTNSPWERGM